MNSAVKYGLIAAAAGLGIYSIVKSNQEEKDIEQMALENQSDIQNALDIANAKSTIDFKKKSPDANFVAKLEAAFQATPNWSEFRGQTAAGSEGAWFGLKRSSDYNPIAYCMVVSFDNIYAARRMKDGTWNFTQFLNENNIA